MWVKRKDADIQNKKTINTQHHHNICRQHLHTDTDHKDYHYIRTMKSNMCIDQPKKLTSMRNIKEELLDNLLIRFYLLFY